MNHFRGSRDTATIKFLIYSCRNSIGQRFKTTLYQLVRLKKDLVAFPITFFGAASFVQVSRVSFAGAVHGGGCLRNEFHIETILFNYNPWGMITNQVRRAARIEHVGQVFPKAGRESGKED
jgi:hypothetical protein